MAIAQKVVSERRGVQQCLQHRVHKASIPEIIQPSQSLRQLRSTRKRQRARSLPDHGPLDWPRSPGPVIHPPALPQTPRWRRGRGGRRDVLSQHNSGVEIAIVDLVTARTTEQLGSVDVNGDLVARAGGSVGGSVRGAGDGGAGEAGVEAGGRGGAARAAAGDLVRVAADLSTAGRASAEAALEGSEGLGKAVGVGAIAGEVGARRWLPERVAGRHGRRRRAKLHGSLAGGDSGFKALRQDGFFLY